MTAMCRDGGVSCALATDHIATTCLARHPVARAIQVRRDIVVRKPSIRNMTITGVVIIFAAGASVFALSRRPLFHQNKSPVPLLRTWSPLYEYVADFRGNYAICDTSYNLVLIIVDLDTEGVVERPLHYLVVDATPASAVLRSSQHKHDVIVATKRDSLIVMDGSSGLELFVHAISQNGASEWYDMYFDREYSPNQGDILQDTFDFFGIQRSEFPDGLLAGGRGRREVAEVGSTPDIGRAHELSH